MKKVFRKVTCCALAVVAGLSLFGCGSGGNGHEVADEFEGDYLVINLFGHALDELKNPNAGTKKILNVIEDKFLVKFNITTTTVSNSPNLLNQLIGGGDVPDMFIHFKDEPAYSTWLDDEYLMDYEPYLDDYPYLKHAFGALGTEQEVKSFLKGGYYSYPIVIHNDTESGELTTELGMFYRRDWYQALANKGWAPSSGRALKDPEAEDFDYLNFYDLMEGYTYGDPDGNGKDDTYGYSLTKDEGVHWWFPILNMFNAFRQGWYRDEDGVWQPEDISDNMHDAVMFMADMYDRGFINSNYNTVTTQEMSKNNFINGKAGVVVYNVTANMGSGIVDSMEGFLGKVAGSQKMIDVVRGMPVVTGRDGVKRVLGSVNNYAYMAINNDVSEYKKKTILSVLNYILSPEGDTLLTWGIEGEHYEVKPDGTKKSLLPLNERGYQKVLIDDGVAPGVYRLKGLASWSTPFTNDPRPQKEVTDNLMTAWDPKYMVIDELTFVTVDPSFSTVIADLTDRTAIAFKQIVNKTDGTEAQRKAAREELWDSYVAKYKQKSSNYIAAMNQAAKELYPDGK